MSDALQKLLSTMFQAHPWHGITPYPAGDPNADPSAPLHAFIEIVPTDTVKYELHKPSGHLMVDRPQRLSSLCPMPYGFIPQTYCGDEIGRRCQARTQQARTIRGDGDPLDICVLTEKTFGQGNFLARVRPIGGLRMVDHDEADDKIIAVLIDDAAFGHMRDLSDCPAPLVERLQHYFLTYKLRPGSTQPVQIAEVYDRAEALNVISLSVTDYVNSFGDPLRRTASLLEMLRKA